MTILYSQPPKDHTQICLDEQLGLELHGATCHDFLYGNNDSSLKIVKLFKTILNALNVIFKCYKIKPDWIYLNSRISKIGFFS